MDVGYIIAVLGQRDSECRSTAAAPTVRMSSCTICAFFERYVYTWLHTALRLDQLLLVLVTSPCCDRLAAAAVVVAAAVKHVVHPLTVSGKTLPE